MKSILKILRSILLSVFMILLSVLFQNSGCDKTVSVSPPDKPPPNGYIYIDSNPEGSHIYLNGKARRRATPDSLNWLSTNSYTITLKKELYRDTSFVVNIVEGKRLNVFVDYTKNPAMRGKIYCTSLPSHAEIYIDSLYTGLRTPNTIDKLLPGYYNITYKLDKHRDIASQATVRSSTTTPLYAILVDTTIWTDYNTGNSEIATNELSCMTIDNNSKLWIGTYHYGIIIYDGSKFLNYQKILTGLASNKINCIECLKQNNNIWVGMDVGLQHYYGDGPNDLRGDLAWPISSIAAKRESLIAVSIESHIIAIIDNARLDYYYPTSLTSPDFNITAMVYGSSDHLWIGTKNGGAAQRFGDEWEFYNTSNSKIYSNQITTLIIDHSGIIWAGHALSDRLSYYDGNSWQSYFIFPDRYKVNAFYVDSRNRLWIGTNHGFIEKDGNTIKFFNYDNSGLNINNVSGIAVDNNGYAWITTYDAGLFEYRGAN